MYPVINTKETGNRIRKIMKIRGLSAKDVQRYLNLSCVQSVYHWLDGSSMPTIDNLYALSALLYVPIDALVCGNRTDMFFTYCNYGGTDQMHRIIAYYERIKNMKAA